jgi:hypothetical protein
MWLSLDKKVYRRFHDVIVPGYNGTTQIDHILISKFGIFIVETKNKSGWIFGSEDQARWTQTFHRKKFSFQNPLRQTYRQKRVLADFLGIYDDCIHTIVCFVGDCSFKTPMPENVLRFGLGRYIKSFSDPFLPDDFVQEVTLRLEELISESKLSRRDHVRSLNERLNSDTVCPKCGSDLVVKVARNGPRAGAEFLGCESYPRCRFTRNF